MENIQIIALIALGWCIVFCFIQFFRLLKLGKVKDLSQKSGDVKAGVIYSNTTAMMPAEKESAYKHLPTYTAGIIFHLGSFLALLLFVLMLFNINGKIWSWLLCNGWWILAGAACFLLISSLCGLSLFFKRVFSKKLRPFSNYDDYFSNGVVTLFQLFSCAFFALFALVAIFNFRDELERIREIHILCSYFTAIIYCGYYISAILLFLYLPFGKLKHAIYYFAARYHLGFFYGWRNSWPPKKSKN